MQQPEYYARRDFGNIPDSFGIYAFYLDFEYLLRAVKSRPAPVVGDVEALLEKSKRAHRLSNPDDVRINVYGKSVEFSSFYQIRARHLIECGPLPTGMPPADLLEFANVLDKCTLITTPLYIGIAEKQFLSDRFGQHKSKYERLKKRIPKVRSPPGDKKFDRGQEFYHRLVRRQIEFRDLVFACVELTSSEIRFARPVEKLLHAYVNPPLSDKH